MAIVLLLSAPLDGAVILQPNLANSEINYTNGGGSTVYGKIIGGSTIFQDKSLRLKLEELYYPAHNLVNLNNGSAIFQINPVNWSAGIQPPGGYKLIPIFAIANDKGYAWLWVFLSNTSSGSRICFNSWDNNRAIIQASWLIDPKSSFLKKGQWTRLSATWDPQYIRIYLDGKEIAHASYGLGSARNTSPDMLIRIMPENYAGVKYSLDTLIKDLTLYDHTLSPAEVKADYESAGIQSENILRKSALVFPRSVQKPQIDGKLDSAEWLDAASFPLQKRNSSTLLDSDLPAQVYAKYDNENIYLAFNVKYSGELFLPAPANSFSPLVYGGNLVEFYYRKNNEDINKYYQFTVGANNAFAVRMPDNQIADLPFSHAATINDREWNVEMAIPIHLFDGLTSGDTFSGNFGLHRPEATQLGALDRWIAWSGAKRDAFFRNVGQITLGASEDATRLQLNGKLNYGTPEIIWDSASPANISLEFLDGCGKSVIEKKYTGVTKFNFNDELKWQGGGFMLLHATAPDGKVLCDYSGKIMIRDPYTVNYDCFASLNKILLHLDLQGLKTDLKTKPISFRATLTGEKDGQLYASANALLNKNISTVELPFKELKVGKYKLSCGITADGNEIVREMIFVRPDDEFIRKPAGEERTVPQPWSKLTRIDDTVSGKYFTYKFRTDNPFLEQAVIHGRKVLQSTQMLVGNQDVSAEFRVVESKNIESSPDRIIDIGTLESDNLKIKLDYKRTIAYDGMVRYDLTLTPLDKTVRLEQFKLIFDLPEEICRYAINPEKTPSFIREWKPAPKLEIRQFPTAWLTGLNAGFCVFTDNDANWVYPADSLPLAMIRNDTRTRIEVNFINGPATISTPTPYVLAMMGTPSKPPRSDYRQIHVVGGPKDKGQGGEFYRIRGWEHERNYFYWYRWILMTHLQNPEKARAAIQTFNNRGIKSIPYNCGAVMPDSNPIYDYYGNDWRRYTGGKIQPKSEYMTDLDGTKFYGAVPVCANNRGFADYMAFYLDKYLQEYDLHGLYLDYGGVNPSDTPYKDTSLKDVLNPGHQVSSYNVFGVRDLFERLRKILQKHNQSNVLWLHEWDRYHPAVVSFGDIIYPGEEYMHSIRNNLRVYGEETPLSAWQAAYNSEVYGCAVQFLNQYRYYTDIIADKNKTNQEKMYFARDLMTMTLLHDIPASAYFLEDIYYIFDSCKIKDAVFHAYYTDAQIKTDNDQVKICYYQWEGRPELLMVIGNVSNKAQKFSIDWGNFKVSSAVDAFTGNKVDLMNRQELGDFGFRLLRVRLVQ